MLYFDTFVNPAPACSSPMPHPISPHICSCLLIWADLGSAFLLPPCSQQPMTSAVKYKTFGTDSYYVEYSLASIVAEQYSNQMFSVLSSLMLSIQTSIHRSWHWMGYGRDRVCAVCAKVRQPAEESCCFSSSSCLALYHEYISPTMQVAQTDGYDGVFLTLWIWLSI